MVSIENIQKGLANYLDTELAGKLKDNSLQNVMIKVGISLYIKNFSSKIETLKDNTAIKMLGIFDDSGNIDVDVLRTELENNIPATGMKVDVPMVGTMTFHKDDVEKLYNYIIEQGGI